MISLFQAFLWASESLSLLSHEITEPLYLLRSERDNEELQSKPGLVSFGPQPSTFLKWHMTARMSDCVIVVVASPLHDQSQCWAH